MPNSKKNEKVLCISRKDLPDEWLGQFSAVGISENELLKTLYKADVQWMSRSQAEYNPGFKQLIPYVLLSKPKDILGCYLRAGSEDRLHNLWSIGIGGHLNPVDQPADGDIRGTILSGLNRELSEEIEDLPNTFRPDFIGIINEEGTGVGQVHLGLVYVLWLNSSDQIVPGQELNQFSFSRIRDIQGLKLEIWSSLALELL